MTVVLLLGGSGFIGRPIGAALQASGVDVVAAGLGDRPRDFVGDWLEIDLAEESPALVARRLGSVAPSAIVNATGATSGSVGELARANVLTTARLLDAMDLAGVRARLVHIGSAAEYGRGEVGAAVREGDCARPVGPYGATKLAATQLVAGAVSGGRIDGIVLRVFNPLGPAMPGSTLPGAALARLLAAAAGRSPAIGLGPLGAVRDFVDVRDVAAAVVAACRVPAVGSPVVNVGSGIGRTARDVVRALAVRVGFDGRIEEGGPGSPRSTDVPWQVADISLARAELGWGPGHDLASSVDLMVEAVRA